MPQPPPALDFTGFKVSKIVFDRDNLFTDQEFDINIQFINEYPDPANNLIFHSVFIINLTGVNKDFSVQVQAIGLFKIHDVVDEIVRENYTLISAPSIVFPYIRSFVSNLFLQAGSGPLILPPINFIAKYMEDKQKKSSSEQKS